MFERRLKILLIAPALCAIVILGRLFQLQVVQGRNYVRKVDAALTGPMRYLPALRGRILDRFGRVLAADEPTHDVSVHFGVVSGNEEYRKKLAARLRAQEPALAQLAPGESSEDVHRRIMDEVDRRIRVMWWTLEKASGTPMSDLVKQQDAICATVDRLRLHVWNTRRERGIDQPFESVRLKEQEMFHVILRDVAPDVRTRLEVELSNEPFIRIEPSVRRMWRPEAQPFCHLIGSLGQVTPDMIDTDPFADDPLGAYRPGDTAGITGVERLAETQLRGKRGQQECSLDGEVLLYRAPIDGADVRLTLDLDLQRQVTEVLMRTQVDHPNSTGASCAVIDIHRREVLAMVSVPTFTRADYREHYKELRDNVVYQPLVYKPIQREYPPGSTIKPVTLLAGLAARQITADTTTFCDGSLVPGSKNWHCWTYWKGQSGHGTVSAETALQHSCNIYFYKLGAKLGATVLTDFFRDFCRGPERTFTHHQSTGLFGELHGIIPTADWIKRQMNRTYSPSDARNYSIGQGEVQLTPLQVANMFATLGAGVYRDPTVLMDDGDSRPLQHFRSLTQHDWAIVRNGLHRCVNEQGGTAFSFARMDDLQVSGKTGSSQCVPRVTQRRFTFQLPDGEKLTIDAPTRENARELLGLPESVPCISHFAIASWPPKDPDTKDYPTHAWFAGFAPSDHPRIAVSVLIEHGGAGGRSAGPTAKAVFEAVKTSPRGYLPGYARDVAVIGTTP